MVPGPPQDPLESGMERKKSEKEMWWVGGLQNTLKTPADLIFFPISEELKYLHMPPNSGGFWRIFGNREDFGLFYCITCEYDKI